MSEENHMGWKLVRGVRRDIVNLFKLFANTNSVRFEDFCSVWREIKFSLIFNNRVTVIELLEFTEELFQIIKEYLSSVYEFHTRVAALYTLYGSYFKQPIRGAAKIRFTKTEWQDLKSLIETSKSEKHYDIVFIFTKLYLNGAFTFAATTRPAGLERGYRKYSEKRNTLISKACDVELMYRPLISERLINSLVKLESLYCRKKSDLLGKKNLVFIDGSFAELLQEELKKYASRLQVDQATKSKAQADNERSDDGSDSEHESSQTGGTRPKRAKTSSNKNSKAAKETSKNSNEEVSGKKKKFGKEYSQLVAKRKAEYYVQKYRLTAAKALEKKKLGLEELLESDASES